VLVGDTQHDIKREEGYASMVVLRCRTSEDAQLLSYAYETHDVLIR